MTQTTCELRVRYSETDKMGVVYYANYFAWFEVGRSDLLRQRGMSYRELESQGVILPVVEAQCRYVKSARYDDLLRITTRSTPSSRVRIHFDYEIHRAEDEELLATGTTDHVAVDSRGKPRRLPEKVMRILE